MRSLSTALYLAAVLVICWALTIGLTWAPCYSQVCPERYHPMATRIHTVAYYALLTTIVLALLLRAHSSNARTLSQYHLTLRELPILRKRISVGGLLFGIWMTSVILATTAFWIDPLMHYWYRRLWPVGWGKSVPKLVLTGIFAHHADILLGLLLLPVGRNSVIGRAFDLQQHTLLYAHKLLAYLTVFSVITHGVTYYTFVADYLAVPRTHENGRKLLAIDVENPNLKFLDLIQGKISFYYGVSLFTGTVCLFLMLIVVVTSLPLLRRRAYNTFYYLHVTLSGLIFIGASIHSSTNFYFVLPGLFLWIIDRFWRLFFGDFGLVRSVNGTIEDIGHGWYRVAFPARLRHHLPDLSEETDGKIASEDHVPEHPLQTYYLTVPSVSRLQHHAFSAASIGTAVTGPVFLFQRTSIEGKGRGKQKKIMKKQWTWKLSRKAEASHDGEDSAIKRLRLRVEGPYFPPNRGFETADRMLCVVGGTGVTGALGLAEWFLLHRTQDTRTIMTIIWTVRNASISHLPEWQTLMARSAETGGRLHLRLHVSYEYGRLNVSDAVRAELAGHGEAAAGSAWVYISGPTGLLVTAEDVCCDIEAELRASRKSGTASGFAMQTISYQVAKWEV